MNKTYRRIIVLAIAIFTISGAVAYSAKVTDHSNSEQSNTRPCYTCQQTGRCTGCHGTGTIKAYTIDGTKILTCPSCNGTGKCQYCGGDGIKGN